jgi:hypothetical protein
VTPTFAVQSVDLKVAACGSWTRRIDHVEYSWQMYVTSPQAALDNRRARHVPLATARLVVCSAVLE